MRKSLPFQSSTIRTLLKTFGLVLLLSLLITNSFFLRAQGQPQLLKDLNVGPADNDRNEKYLTAGTTRMYFVYNNALWKSNGSTSATVKLKTFLSIQKPELL